MVSDNFAFIIHPIDPKRDVSRKYPLLGKVLTEQQINFFSTFFPPVYISEIGGIVSRHDARGLNGWFVACPFTPARMLQLPPRVVYRKIVQTGKMAQRLGARILGLGAFTSVVGDAGVTISEQLAIPVTTGDSYTVAVAVESVREAARQMDIQLDEARAAVVGATGAIGSVCAELLAHDVAELHLVGRRAEALEAVREKVEGHGARVYTATNLDVLAQADLILSVTSSIGPIIHTEHIKPGAVVCDVARPRDVSCAVAATRDDVLVIEGGMVEVPGSVDFHFDFGFPPGMAYACMAETMILALEGRYESFTLGKQIEVEKVHEITQLATKHGFRLNGFRSFEREVTQEHIASVRERAWAAGDVV
jgi:predicted amino acid dehydrogenase